jgi:hypothetical protein
MHCFCLIIYEKKKCDKISEFQINLSQKQEVQIFEMTIYNSTFNAQHRVQGGFTINQPKWFCDQKKIIPSSNVLSARNKINMLVS